MATKKRKPVEFDWRKSDGKTSDLINTAPTRDSKWSEVVSCSPPSSQFVNRP